MLVDSVRVPSWTHLPGEHAKPRLLLVTNLLTPPGLLRAGKYTHCCCQRNRPLISIRRLGSGASGSAAPDRIMISTQGRSFRYAIEARCQAKTADRGFVIRCCCICMQHAATFALLEFAELDRSSGAFSNARSHGHCHDCRNKWLVTVMLSRTHDSGSSPQDSMSPITEYKGG